MSPLSTNKIPTTTIFAIALEERLFGQMDRIGQMEKMMRMIRRKPTKRKIIPKVKVMMKKLLDGASINSSTVYFLER